MANRSMAAKAERAKRQARELASVEGSKPMLKRHETLGAANAVRAQVAEMVAAFKGQVVRCEPGRRIEPIGKGRRMAYRDGCERGSAKRVRQGLSWDVWAAQ